ncbi:hypothetical protein BD324DRAFT_603832 [Kockovaella imperatae]|uniref:Mediator of RNA polymerase II transcription subunit 14 n=1 Tax=Kockovaella imperatae TaxID=4999 RepID=A0A1Y1UAD7_9TREE|nr:hypothetical protein BD324DRAFT_603832 [Kockovaella imperatae]ORX34998.1 hypothetical protein BD324DRAFT_603832 [Kockovaella imperatae]
MSNPNVTMEPTYQNGSMVASTSKVNTVESNGHIDLSEPMMDGPKPTTVHPHNPQLGPEPWFTYPTPTPSQLEQDLPPYDEIEGVPLGLVLDRVVRKGYGDMKTLLGQTLPSATTKNRPRHVIEYAKSQRQAVLKYLAVLRWKMAVDIDIPGPSTASHPHPLAQHAYNANSHPTPSFPTPHSIGESSNTSPSAEVISGKGKGRATEDDGAVMPRGKVTDAKRITHFMEHQNRQHEQAIGHVQHVAKMIEALRERNPDLLTAIALLETGTYSRLPTALTESFAPLVPLTNRKILRTLRKLNRSLLYRLKCVDYVPPELIIRAVRDGKVYVAGGGNHGWRASLTMVANGDGGEDSRWWLTGIEWGWRYKGRGVHDPGGVGGFRKVTGEARQGILEVVNEEILRPREEHGDIGDNEDPAVATDHSADRKVDAPFVRLVNFIEHLNLTQQLEALYLEAMRLNQGRWRSSLQVEMKRDESVLIVRYWIRPRPTAPPNAAQPKRGQDSRYIFGGTLSIAVAETGKPSMLNDLFCGIQTGGVIPSERVLNLRLDVKWEIGEAGSAGTLKAGEVMDSSSLRIDSSNLSLEDALNTAARAHATHLLQAYTSSLDISRLTLLPLKPPNLITHPASQGLNDEPIDHYAIPLPSKQGDSALKITVSPFNGYIEIADETGNEGRTLRARMATISVNESKLRMTDDLVRLITAIITENLENQMRQLGWIPVRRLPIRYQDLPKNDLFPASSVFVPLPTSTLHHLVAKVTPAGIVFELLRLVRTPSDGGVMKFAIGDRSVLDMARLKARRPRGSVDRGVEAAGATVADPTGVNALLSAVGQDTPASPSESSFEIANRDLMDMYIFSNALVAQTIIEQQLKDRSIPYTLQYPPITGKGAPKSSSAVAGMIPALCVNTRDLLKDARVAEVAMPRVYIQIRDWWKGHQCQVVTVVQLRHRPSLASAATSPLPPTVSVPSTASNSDSITLDPSSSIVRFRENDISRCVPSFLEEWERLSKVLVVAGEVNRLNKSAPFKHLKMLAFDLCTATLSYAPGYSCSITYTPSDDSYEVSFSTTTGTDGEVLSESAKNPHEMLQDLFSHKLNELSKARNVKISLAKAFCELLCNTLPILLTINNLRSTSRDFPKLVVRSISAYRLVWDVDAKRYALDVSLARSNRCIVSDGSIDTLDTSCGPLTPIPGFEQHTMGIKTEFEGGIAAEGAGEGEGEGEGEEGGQEKRKESERLVLLDEGRAILCPVHLVSQVMTSLAAAIETSVGYRG